MAPALNGRSDSTGLWSPARVLPLAGRAVVRGAIDFYNSNNLTFASSIAYYTLLSFFPFVLISLDLLGRFAVEHGDKPFLRLVALVLPSQLDFVVTQTDELSRAPLRLSVIGVVLLIWASMGVFSAVTSAVNYAWGVERPLSYLKNKLVSFVMLVAAGALLLVTLGFMSAMQARHADWFTRLTAVVPGLVHLESLAARSAPTVMLILIIGTIYYFVPNTKVRLREVWLGAILAGILWRIAFSAFAVYIRGYSRWSVHGSITTVVLFLVWVYVSAVILLYGVEVSAAYARLDTEDRAARASLSQPEATG